MLNHIKKMLPYPYTGAAYTIYSIADIRELREHVKYNGELDQFEIPISVLNVKGKLCEINHSDSNVEGTSIYYYVDYEDNFCFRIE